MINWKYVAKRFARRAFNWRYNFRELGKDNANNIRMLQDCRRERDQLRAELEEAKRRVSQINDNAIDIADANVKLRADNEALRGRLKTMTLMWEGLRDFITTVREIHPTITAQVDGHRVIKWTAARRSPSPPATEPCSLSSGSPTGEAPTSLFEFAQTGGQLHKPAAPEPAPAPTWPPFPHAFVQGGLVSDMCGQVVGKGRDGDDIVCALAADEHAATPASAQGPTERPCPRCGSSVSTLSSSMVCDRCGALWTEAYESGRAFGIGQRDSGLEALDKRVAALEEKADRLGSALFDHEVTCKSAPPRPAPIERHAYQRSAFPNEPNCSYYLNDGHGRCGQSRSAAIHGEGGK